MKLLRILSAPGLLCLLGLAACTTTPPLAPPATPLALGRPGTPGQGQRPQDNPVSGTAGATVVDPTRARPGSFPSGALLPITSSSASARQQVAALSPPKDLWERIRRGYDIPNLEGDLVQDREQWYTARPDYIFRMTERSRKYLFYIVEELERRNMPSELALLPFIESAFNPQAMSTAKAAGMWQFVPSTGKYFALKQNIFRDDRRDVLASTRAALDYLQKLYGMFGDWQLALAAYNWGEGSVQRAIAKNQRAGLPTGYADLNMPMETRLYIPKLQAVKNIVAAPENMNVQLPDIGNHPYFQEVPITRDIDVALAAKLADVNLEDFKALNPSANHPVIMAAGTPQILLPWDNATVFQQNLEAYTGGRLATWTAWVAPSTMKVSDAARQVGMGEAELRSINNIPPRMMVKAGSTLLVPRSAQRLTEISTQVADNAQLSFAPEIVLKRTDLKARKAETVASVAQRYNVSVSSVAEWNKVSANASFKTGQQVVVYLPLRAPARMTQSLSGGGRRVAAQHVTPRAVAARRDVTPSIQKTVRIAKR